ncbi:DUF1614 domain-containing protein [uncultured Methanofollis sp.]|uniref:DUF1614 domain-containing protein n=1 Tax=uncultured Methanofollis sp. TaxID=262500 RepID=UPI00261CC7C7|nr:DUF1614 domain-containing protein [uncultured Methanofollis sp.]
MTGVPASVFVPFLSTETLYLFVVLMVPVLLLYLFIIVSEEAFELAGMKASRAIIMTIGALVGSLIDIPFAITDGVVLAVNVGGCIIPLFLSVEVVARQRVRPGPAALAVLFVALVSYYFATPVEGEGILMPFYIAPLAGAFAGILLAGADITSPGTAYVGGAMGTLLGADIFLLATPGTIETISGGEMAVLSIGGAGVFDGIFLTGIIAVFLAAVVARRVRRVDTGV